MTNTTTYDEYTMSDYLYQLHPNGVPSHFIHLKVNGNLCFSYRTFAT